jgi:thioesterase domain-containing protein
MISFLIRRRKQPAPAPVNPDLHLVFLNQGEGMPIFLLPGTGGLCEGYLQLARAFNNTCQVVGVDMMGTKEGDTPLKSVKAIARQNVHWIRQVQPQGPYRLIGHSFGANVAYEMALQLEKAGQEIEFVAILDMLAGRDGTKLTRANKVGLVMQLAADYYRDFNIISEPYPEWVADLERGLASIAIKDMSFYIAGFLKEKLREKPKRIDLVARLVNLRVYNGQMDYRPAKRIRGKLIVFRALLNMPDGVSDSTLGWRRHSRNLELVDLPGNHDVTNISNVTVIADSLKKNMRSGIGSGFVKIVQCND